MINCLNPNIIINKSRHTNKVYRDWSSWRIILRGVEVNSVPPPAKAKIKSNELDDCYYLNVHSGEMIPLYIEVPCNKCIICKDRKAVQWATRVTCEGNYHAFCPWWITLTYNDIHCPAEGLVKRELQNFFKRFRERVSRLLGTDVHIRFVAVGEYGGNTARPHYHAVIFGLPAMDARDVLTMLEHSWSMRVSYKKFRSIMNIYGDRAKDFTFIAPDKNGKTMYYLRYGFAYVKPAHDNTPLYLAKYMFKPEVNTPKGCNPNFCLASRKNGIGYDYIQEYMEYHRRNPHVTQIVFKNKHTEKLCSFGIPQYFKDYWFPTPSKIIPNEVRQAYVRTQSYLNYYSALVNELVKVTDSDYHDDIQQIISDLNEKYFMYRPLHLVNHSYSDDVDRDWNLNCIVNVPNGKKKRVEIFGMFYMQDDCDTIITQSKLDYVRSELIKSYSCILIEYEYMKLLEFDPIWLSELFDKRDILKASYTQQMQSKPQPTPQEQAYRLQKSYNKLKSKDIY